MTQVSKIGDLADLETFDPAAFKADEIVSQEVCSFILALALIFNDLKNLIYADVILRTQRPAGIFKITRHWGDYNGISAHITRLMLGLFHEIISLIDKNEKVLSNPFFQSVISSLNTEERKIWNSLVTAVQEKKPTTPEARLALIVRNTVAFHYDTKVIYNGYNKFFTSEARGSERAYISRGNGTADTRFFFADAAVTGAFKASMEGKDEGLLYQTLRQLLDSLILFKIVHNFYMKIPPSPLYQRGVRGDFHPSLCPRRAWGLFRRGGLHTNRKQMRLDCRGLFYKKK